MSTTYHPDTDVLDELRQAVRKIGPLIREHAEESERGRRLSPQVLAAMSDARLFLAGSHAAGQEYCGVQPEFAMVAF